MSKLKQREFTLRNPLSRLGHGFTLKPTPNSEGGTQNAYLGLYDKNAHNVEEPST